MNPNGGEVQVVLSGAAVTTPPAAASTSITAVTDCSLHDTEV